MSGTYFVFSLRLAVVLYFVRTNSRNTSAFLRYG